MTIKQRIDAINWEDATHQIHDKGYALFPGILESDQCEALVSEYNDTKLYRKTINMAQYRFGQGEYKYYRYPLPDIAAQLRELIYPHLAPLANKWMQLLGITQSYPEDHENFLEQCHLVGQQRPTPLILKYGSGGYNTLHQDLYGEVFFLSRLLFCSANGMTILPEGNCCSPNNVPGSNPKALCCNPNKETW